MPVPSQIQGQKYISLTTFRKNGLAVSTPVWFAELNGRLYVKTPQGSGKCKRLRNNPQVRLAACNFRGKISGAEFAGTARIVPEADWPPAQKALSQKYLLARLAIWSRGNVFIEVEVDSAGVSST